jgi:hypothetical protein
MLLFGLLLATAPEPAPDCHYDRAAMLALSEEAFDQAPTGGWRALQERGCLAEAADLLHDYRLAKPRNRPSVLIWHEGQVRAMMGQTDAAIALFDGSREEAAQKRIGWNDYVDGSIAFLRHDRAGLQQARDRLSRLPKPKKLPSYTVNGQTITIDWPPNLEILDGFLACFDKPYAEAYASDACTPQKK